ncbi:hypothetical protein FVEN_g13032 [Fusarium venenatum]|nr:hypothetical protein FVEN_g13032 [Fusarium venenatum]
MTAEKVSHPKNTLLVPVTPKPKPKSTPSVLIPVTARRSNTSASRESSPEPPKSD